MGTGLVSGPVARALGGGAVKAQLHSRAAASHVVTRHCHDSVKADWGTGWRKEHPLNVVKLHHSVEWLLVQ